MLDNLLNLDVVFGSISIVTAFFLIRLFRASSREKTLKFSVGLAALQICLVWAAITASLQDNISTISCYLGIFGLIGNLIFVFLDLVALTYLVYKKNRPARVEGFSAILKFAILRIFLHTFVSLALLWVALMCTV